MLGALQASSDFIVANEMAGTTGEALERIKGNQVTAFINMLRSMPYDVVDATRCMQELAPDHPSCFSPHQKLTLVAAIQRRAENALDAAPDGAERSGFKQKHMHSFNYYPAYVWNGISDKTKEDFARCEILVEFHQKVIGLKYPDPASRKTIVGILCEAIELQPSAAKLREIYQLFSNLNAEYRRQSLGYPRRNEVYPESVNDFITIHMDAYHADHPAIASRVRANQVARIANRVSARRNNKLLCESKNEAIVLASSSPLWSPTPMMASIDGRNMMQMMMQNMCQTFQRMQGQTPRDSDINLKINEPKKKFELDSPSETPGMNRAFTVVLDQEPSPLNDTPSPGSTIEIINAPDSAPPCSKRERDDIDDMIDCGALVSKKRPAAAMAMSFKLDDPPPLGTKCPLFYNGCKVYENAKAWRVYPFPRESVYDKSFPFVVHTKEAVWQSVIKFCKSPSVPDGSVNNPKKKNSEKAKAKPAGKKN